MPLTWHYCQFAGLTWQQKEVPQETFSALPSIYKAVHFIAQGKLGEKVSNKVNIVSIYIEKKINITNIKSVGTEPKKSTNKLV